MKVWKKYEKKKIIKIHKKQGEKGSS